MRKSLIALSIVAAAFTLVRAEAPAKKEPAKDAAMKCCPMDPQAAEAIDRVKALSGEWTTTSTDGQPAMSVVFHATSGGTAVMETMMPGSDHEMVNLYTADGATILLTHYCAMGNQPRMKLSSDSDAKTMKFQFVDGGNIKSVNDPHMGAVTLSIDGDKLTEDWANYVDGKVAGHTVLELHRKAK